MIFKIKFFVFWLLCLQSCFYALAQTSARFNDINPGIQQWFQGYYITQVNDTVHGYIFLTNQIDNQMQFKYSKDKPPAPDEKTFQADKVNGFSVKDRIYESLPMVTNKNSSPAFVR